MIKLFRRIRYDLMDKNKTSKPSFAASRYFKYAIGEILLVVIGILIALSINNWKTNNLDRLSEADYLKRLSNDLATDTLTYYWTYNSLLKKQEALESIMVHLSNTKDLDLHPIELLTNLKAGMNLTFAHPRPVTSTFEELKNTGSFIKIKNSELRSILNNYYFDKEHQYYRIEQKRIRPSYGDELDKIIPGLHYINDEIKFRSDLVSFKEILDEIKKTEFKKLLVSEFNLAIFMQRIQKEGLRDAKKLLNQIKTELEKLQN